MANSLRLKQNVDSAGPAVLRPNKTSKRVTRLKTLSSKLETTSRLKKITELAIRLFEGNKAAALLWINSPHGVLGNKTPAELAKSQRGTIEVVNLIGRLEHGVFS